MLAGRYELAERIGEGGMGYVFRARDLQLDRWVALKVLRPERMSSERTLKRFMREMKVTTQLEHPHTVRVYDYGVTDGGDFYLAMELLTGRTLLDLLNAEGPMPPARALELTEQLMTALMAAHEKGIVHRDLKPENLFLVKAAGKTDWLKVLDFGVARSLLSDDDRITGTDVVVGTPRYISPEQAMAAEIDHRSDLYGAGVMLYLMLTARLPFVARNNRDFIKAHVETPPPRASDHADVPPWVDELIRKLMAKKRENRPQTAAEVLELIREGRASQPLPLPTERAAPLAAAATLAEEDVEPSRPDRRRLAWLLAFTVVAIAAAAVAIVLSSGANGANVPRSPDAPTPAPVGQQAGTPGSVDRGAAAPAAERASVAVIPLSGNGAAGHTNTMREALAADGAIELAADDPTRLAFVELRDARAVGKRMGVAAVLTGSVSESATGHVFDLRLVATADGQVLWSERADVAIGSEKEALERMARAIAKRLGAAR